ncbi:hypothetical protein EOE66_10320 [Rubrivivax rivuli]|uniref:Uncharacterized protein n=1 Tax=Rubrivivax rivuli TaxID=1862385 RepID=A0A437RIZ8_9BURK|nr:hypothetical protein EOE66_10320 [Rubrivivax rivuli]
MACRKPLMLPRTPAGGL